MSRDNLPVHFSKLNDPDDDTLTKLYKHLNHYSTPGLYPFGVLVPAPDALFPRLALAGIQLGVAGILFAGARNKLQSGWRRLGLGLGSLSIGFPALFEIHMDLHPERNPLYVEMRLARQLRADDRRNHTALGWYWYGPTNFTSMGSAKYLRCETLMLLSRSYTQRYLVSDVIKMIPAIQSDDAILTDKVCDVVSSNAEYVDAKKQRVPDYGVFDVAENDGLHRVEEEWSQHHPLDRLRILQQEKYLDYDFPRMQMTEEEKGGDDKDDKKDDK